MCINNPTLKLNINAVNINMKNGINKLVVQSTPNVYCLQRIKWFEYSIYLRISEYGFGTVGLVKLLSIHGFWITRIRISEFIFFGQWIRISEYPKIYRFELFLYRNKTSNKNLIDC